MFNTMTFATARVAFKTSHPAGKAPIVIDRECAFTRVTCITVTNSLRKKMVR
ncbi:MAG: hypothetical protein VX346_20500 [Planctomycetota bacterium]|nr:hypothetical protein [Planctomycetota bacterium]